MPGYLPLLLIALLGCLNIFNLLPKNKKKSLENCTCTFPLLVSTPYNYKLTYENSNKIKFRKKEKIAMTVFDIKQLHVFLSS